MWFTITRYVVLMLLCLAGLIQANAQGGIASITGNVQNSVNTVDPNAAKLLQQMGAAYKLMRSFSVEYEEGTRSIQGKVSILYHAKFAFRRPHHLALTTTSKTERVLGPNKVVTDGTHAYMMLARTPNAYTEVPDVVGADSPFDVTARIPHLRGIDWIERLLEGKGIEAEYTKWNLRSLTVKQEALAGAGPVEIVTARWDLTRDASADWKTCTYTIGRRDHLLYQATAQANDGSLFRVARFLHSQHNAKLPDSVFAPPHDASRLPLLRVVAVNEPTITLDKGILDGVAVGDRLDVYNDEKLRVWTAQLLVKKVQAHTCEADLINSVARVNNICLIVEHKADSTDVKQKAKR